ncbi:MAG TPA: histone-like nucleoid-structuring protein Lsr2 [Pseudolysinimonas sp.]|nr:histone-like nucleoid-structuring protein Lsr2 [Pseudolysinimonas sp.]
MIDVETTGLSPEADRIIEIAMVRLEPGGTVVDEWSTRLDPQGPVGATHIHGLTQSDVEGQPLFGAVASQLATMLGRLPIVAHNATFDIAFVRSEFNRAGWDVPELASYCTLGGSAEYFPDLRRRRLGECCWAAGIHLDGAHSALGDARATASLFATYLARDPLLHEPLLREPTGEWPPGPSRAPAVWVPPVRSSIPIRITQSRPSGPPLVKQLSGLSLADVIDEGAPVGSLGYLETLLSALEDGELSTAEAQQLAGLSYAFELNESDVATIHRAFVFALAHRALDDGHVSRLERDELHQLAALVGVAGETVVDLIAQADAARSTRMSSELQPLPDDWAHGEPLRVGDKVVFTGCDPEQRTRLEKRAERLGVRVVGGVSRQTAMLVTDGGFHGTKAAKASELSVRLVHPDVFDQMLTHLQPAVPQPQPKAREIPRKTTHAERAPVRDMSTQQGARGASPSAVRAWAISNGIEVGTRGRLHADVFDAYWSAQTTEGGYAG